MTVIQQSNSKVFKMADLFSGIGGIRLGFEQAFEKTETVFVSEWNSDAIKTYQANFVDSVPIAGDIRQVDENAVPPFDICLAGFPCSMFSIAGKRKGFSDKEQGRLIFEVVRICRKVQPMVIFCENVKGLVYHDRGNTLAIIIRLFEEIGYNVYFKVLNSKDFGVPQNRERVYMVCFRSDIDPGRFEFPEKVGEPVTIADILQEGPIPAKYYLSQGRWESLQNRKVRYESQGYGFGPVIRDWNGIAGACICGGMGHERNLISDHRPHSMVPTTNIKSPINTDDVRILTPREWARLQGFSDVFVLIGADTKLYFQLGNSVTIPVVRAIAEDISRVLGGL